MSSQSNILDIRLNNKGISRRLRAYLGFTPCIALPVHYHIASVILLNRPGGVSDYPNMKAATRWQN